MHDTPDCERPRQEEVTTYDDSSVSDYLKKETERRIQIISAAYDRAAAYTNLVILAGYAGTFTLWSFTKDFLPENTAITIALMMGISLFSFCGWEVYKMIYTSGHLRKQAEILLRGLSPEQLDKALNDAQAESNKKHVELYKHWIIILIIAIPTGFGGALLMFYNFIANLSDLLNSP